MSRPPGPPAARAQWRPASSVADRSFVWYHRVRIAGQYSAVAAEQSRCVIEVAGKQCPVEIGEIARRHTDQNGPCERLPSGAAADRHAEQVPLRQAAMDQAANFH